MGIKHFYSWFRKHDGLKKSISSSVPIDIDHLLIDMNGVIHEAAQRVFKYGKYDPQRARIIIPQRRLKKTATKSPDLHTCIKREINKIISITNPRKSLYLAIDGVAPMSKQNQQRQRRFRVANENKEKDDVGFDSTCITAGTEFMWELSQNISNDEWVISNHPINVIISDDSKPGEGEHKLMNWIRHNDDLNGTYCVVGQDADLILLCCALPKTHVYVMREDDSRNYDYIDINMTRNELTVTPDDFIIWSCFIGNDFLPPIPSLEIKESAPEIGALDFFFENYNKPLINKKNGYFNLKEIIRLLKLLSDREHAIMEARHQEEDDVRFPNQLWKGDIKKYRTDWISDKFEPNVDVNQIVFDYMKTVQWVYLYYTKGIRTDNKSFNSWGWFYHYNYAPHASDFIKGIRTLQIISFGFKPMRPSYPHEQLLRVLPPSSKYLLPSYLHDYMDRLGARYTTFKTDKAGKRQEWEAVTIVDFVELDENIIRK
jgi:5'-3' exonuclease